MSGVDIYREKMSGDIKRNSNFWAKIQDGGEIGDGHGPGWPVPCVRRGRDIPGPPLPLSKGGPGPSQLRPVGNGPKTGPGGPFS